MASQIDNLTINDDTSGLIRTVDPSTDDIVLSVDLTLQSGGIVQADNFKRGSGDPNGVVLGNEGDVFIRTDVGNGRIYVNTDGTITGWEVTLLPSTLSVPLSDVLTAGNTSGGQSIDVNGGGVYNLNGNRLNTSSYAFNTTTQTFTTTLTVLGFQAGFLSPLTSFTAPGVFTILEDGFYLLSWSVGLRVTFNQRTQAQSYVYLNGALFPGTVSEHYLRQAGHGASGGGTLTSFFDAGDEIDIRAVRVTGSGTVTTVAQATRINIMRVS